MYKRRSWAAVTILVTALLGCEVVPHINSGPNVTLIDTEQKEEEEFVHMQAPITREGTLAPTKNASGKEGPSEYQCMQKVREQVVATRDQHWTQKRIDAAIDRCLSATP